MKSINPLISEIIIVLMLCILGATLSSNLYGNVAQTHIQRGQATFNRLNPWARGHGTQAMPTSQLSSSMLAEHQNGGPNMSSDDEQITVCWQFRTSKAKSLDSSLGLCSRNWSINMLMTGILFTTISPHFDTHLYPNRYKK